MGGCRSLPPVLPSRRGLSSYAYAHAEGSGAVSGGLDGLLAARKRLLSAGSRPTHTLYTPASTFSLPYQTTAGGNLYYGSGFTDGSLDYPAHLQEHTTFDLSVGKSFAERFTVSVTALNLTNRRFLLDNSLTFGGTHYADPRQVYVQLRYQFHL